MKSFTFSTVIRQITGDYNYTVVPVPEDLALKSGYKGRERIKASFPGGRYIYCSLQRSKDNEFFIYLGKYFREKSGVDPGDHVTIKITPDNSELGMEMPAELAEVLAMDEEASAIWKKLTPGRKRTVAYFILKAKSVDTRINRSLLVADNMKMGFTKPTQITKRHG